MMNSDLQNKMYHFEANPPSEVWNKIADALDADAEQSFPQRLFEYEEQPPVQAWEKIEDSLENSNSPVIKVIPFTRFKKPLRYVAAAASIIAIATLFITTFNNKNAGAGAIVGGTEPVTVSPNQSSVAPLNLPVTEDNIVSIPDRNRSQSFENESNETYRTTAKTSRASIHPLNGLSAFSFSQDFIPEKANKEAMFDFSALNNYMVYSDGDGLTLKLPKKLFSLVYCQDGDDSCKERIHRLQQRLSANTTTTDFIGMVEILRQLQ